MPAIGMHWPDGSEIIGFSTKEGENFAGLSGGHFLICIDEASGFSESIFDTVWGNMAGGAHLLLTGNPTQPAGTFFDSHHQSKEQWVTYQVSAYDIAAESEGVPGLATLEWCEARLKQWGPDDPRYAVRVLGKWPDTSTQSVVPYYLVMAAQARWQEAPAEGLLRIGVDPARFGDDLSVVSVRRGQKLIKQVTFGGLDGHQLGGRVAKISAEYHVKGEHLPKIIVDEVGVGASCVDWLNHNTAHSIYPHSGASKAMLEDKYVNARTEGWFMFSDWLKNGGAIPECPSLEADLLAPMYTFDVSKDRYKLERKDEIKKRLGRSPDRGDSAVMSTYEPVGSLVKKPNIGPQGGFGRPGLRFGNQRGF